MGDSSVLPVSRFSPATGLFVDRTEKKIAITGAMEVFGPEATFAVAISIGHSINTTWTANFPDGQAVVCKITVTYRPPENRAGKATQIEAVKAWGPSHVNALTRSMTLNANESDAFTWTAAHEFGHVIGLQDRYSESIMSKLSGMVGGTRSNTVDPRYKTNLMAVVNGALESKNLEDLATENDPSPYWVNDDDYVRDWVNHHVLADVTALSTGTKLAMIKTLMGGWISYDDLVTILRICGSVTRAAEATAIRGGINPLTFTDIGQRTRVRVALASMP